MILGVTDKIFIAICIWFMTGLLLSVFSSVFTSRKISYHYVPGSNNAILDWVVGQFEKIG